MFLETTVEWGNESGMKNEHYGTANIRLAVTFFSVPHSGFRLPASFLIRVHIEIGERPQPKIFFWLRPTAGLRRDEQRPLPELPSETSSWRLAV